MEESTRSMQSSVLVAFGGLMCMPDVKAAFEEHFGARAEAEASAAKSLWGELTQQVRAGVIIASGSIERDGRTFTWGPSDTNGLILTLTQPESGPGTYTLDVRAGFFSDRICGPYVHEFRLGDVTPAPAN